MRSLIYFRSKWTKAINYYLIDKRRRRYTTDIHEISTALKNDYLQNENNNVKFQVNANSK